MRADNRAPCLCVQPTRFMQRPRGDSAKTCVVFIYLLMQARGRVLPAATEWLRLRLVHAAGRAARRARPRNGDHLVALAVEHGPIQAPRRRVCA